MKTPFVSIPFLHAEETSLARGRTVQLEARKGLELGCVSGRVWITQAGDASDYLLQAGQHLRFPASGRIVAEALTDRAVLWRGYHATKE